MKRSRLAYFVGAVFIVFLGLASRRYAAALPVFIAEYAGDTLWALMVFAIVGFLAPRWSSLRVAAVALAVAYVVEASQFYHAPWIESLRGTRLGGLVLGFGFLWTDLVCYAVGVMLGVMLEAGQRRRHDDAPLTVWDRLKPRLAALKRWINARSRPTGQANSRRLQERAESLDSITLREAVAADIPALAELHVTTWNATYNTTRGPTVATRTSQWNQVFAKQNRRDFILILEDKNRRLIGFAWGRPHEGEVEGELSKIYLRWEYHGLGLGRRLIVETARQFLQRGIHSFVLFAELSNPTLGFYDRMGGERMLDDRGQFNGGYRWRDVRTLIG